MHVGYGEPFSKVKHSSNILHGGEACAETSKLVVVTIGTLKGGAKWTFNIFHTRSTAVETVGCNYQAYYFLVLGVPRMKSFW